MEVLATSVQPQVDGLPVVAFYVRAQMVASGLGFWSDASVTGSPGVDSGETSCNAQLVRANPLFGADPGTMYPELYGSPGAPGDVHDGWITFKISSTRDLARCVLTVRLQTGYFPAPASPGGLIMETYGQQDVASIQVRGDGTALTATPLPTQQPSPSPSPTPDNGIFAAGTRALLSRLSDALGTWNAAAAPVVAPLLAANPDPLAWANSTVAARKHLNDVYWTQLFPLGDMTAKPPLVDGQEALVDSDVYLGIDALLMSYAEKLDGFNGLAQAAAAGDQQGWTSAFAEVRKGIIDQPPAVRQILSEASRFLTADEIAGWEQAAPSVDQQLAAP
ncbi:MAG: hypothetical protein ACYDCI_10275 [Candidatus Limnocylindrales bacterium]